MSKSTFPVSEAKPLIEIPSYIPQIGFLGGEQGREINDSIQRDYKGVKALQIGNYKDGIVKGSNPFYAIAVQSRLPSGVSIASQSDLETAMRIGSMDFSETYEDTGLVLRTDKEPNSYLASNLMKQVKARGSKKMPVMIPLRGLELEADSNSPHGLAFKLGENSELIYAPILNNTNGNFSSQDVDEKTGLPSNLSGGNRTLYTRSDGLSGLYLYRFLGLDSDYGDLAGSGDSGRVVLVSTAEGVAPKNSDSYIKQVEQTYQDEVKRLESIKNKAISEMQRK
ncbi:MAG: hypothetical protein ACHQUA_02880 [Microgenomates group bacterium]